MDGYLSKKTVQDVVEILNSSQRTQMMVDNNYQIAARHFSYSVLRSQLTAAIRMFYGDSVAPLKAGAVDAETEDFLYIDPQAVVYERYGAQDCRINS